MKKYLWNKEPLIVSIITVNWVTTVGHSVFTRILWGSQGYYPYFPDEETDLEG